MSIYHIRKCCIEFENSQMDIHDDYDHLVNT
jgi:hypothetical protein